MISGDHKLNYPYLYKSRIIPRVKWVHLAAILAVDGIIKGPVVSDTEMEKRDTTRASLKNSFKMDIKHGHDIDCKINSKICIFQFKCTRISNTCTKIVSARNDTKTEDACFSCDGSTRKTVTN